MPSFKVGFLRDDKTVKIIYVNAFNSIEAFIKAEELYKVKGWKFQYDDLYGNINS